MDKKHRENLIKNHKLRLQALREQEALQGVSTDPSILIEINDIEKTVADLQKELADLEKADPDQDLPETTMKSPPFKTGGTLTEEDLEVYVERRADADALFHVQKMNYLLVIEPRQQGKTSLISHMMLRSISSNIAWAYADMTTLDKSSEEKWYKTLCSRILGQLDNFIPPNRWPALPKNWAEWRAFLVEIAQSATTAGGQIIIALDEIGAVEFPQATEFFSVLRDVYNSRQAEPYLKQLTFWLVGAFRPHDLIEDEKISPFNIAQRIYLMDFTLEQVRQLVSKGGWSYEQTHTLAERIHYWTNGQPYLTQLLCSYLGPTATSADVDASIERLRREDRNHLPSLLNRLHKDEKLLSYAIKIQDGAPIKFFPGENRRHAQLELLGLVKADQEGYCMIRNRLYELVLKETATD